MEKENHSEDVDLSPDNNGDQQDTDQQDQGSGDSQDQGQQDSGQQDAQQEDYRGKLNATNRFLESEGYAFNKTTKRWEKPAASEQRQSSQQAQTQAPATTGLSKEEAILYAKGFTEDEVEQAKKVAGLQGVKLTEAINDDLFTGWKSKKDERAKAEKAQLGVSRGARAAQKKSFNTPGLSDEEHRQLFQERAAR